MEDAKVRRRERGRMGKGEGGGERGGKRKEGKVSREREKEGE